MLTRFFSNLRVESLALALAMSYFISALIWLPQLQVTQITPTVFGFITLPTTLIKTLAFSTLPLISLLLTATLNHIGLIKKNFIAQVLISALLTLGFHYTPQVNFIVLSLISVWMARELLSLGGAARFEEPLFKGGLLIGLYLIFIPQAWLLLACYLVALIAYGGVQLRYFILPFFGAGAFLVNLFLWPYLLNFPLDIEQFTTNLTPQFSGFDHVEKAPYFLLSLFALCVLEYLSGLSKAKIVKRQFMGVVIYNILLATLAFILLDGALYWFAPGLVFGSVLLANSVNYLENRWLKDLLFISPVAYTIIVYVWF